MPRDLLENPISELHYKFPQTGGVKNIHEYHEKLVFQPLFTKAMINKLRLPDPPRRGQNDIFPI